MSVDYRCLGKRIREKRDQIEMSQGALAAAAGISTQHMSNIENAKTRVGLERLVDIANALSVSVDELLCDSVVKSTEVYYNEILGIVEKFSDAELRTLPEFLRCFSHFTKFVENKYKKDDN